MNRIEDRKLQPETFVRIVGVAFFAYLFFGFMLFPCLNTLTSIFNTKTPRASAIPLRSSASSSRGTCASMCGTR